MLIDQRDAATDVRWQVFVLQKHKLALLHFHTSLAFGRDMRAGLFRLPILVQILMSPIEIRPVNNGAVGTQSLQLGRRFSPGFIVVEERVNRRMPFKKRNRFRQVDDRVQHCDIGLQSLFHREVG